MIVKIEALKDIVCDKRRIVVVGSGAVGMHLAANLAKGLHQVVVLESGNSTLGGFDASTYASVGHKHDGIRIGRSRTLGGTTNLWGGQLVEFMPSDFGGRAWLEHSRWPVGYDELSKFYPATYEALGILSGIQNDDFVWRSIGKSSPQLSQDLEVFLTRWMKQPNIAEVYRQQIEASPDLIVVTGATVTGFCFSGSQVSGVEVVGDCGWRGLVSGDDFVLAAGTIEIVRLMLYAAQRTEGCPWSENQRLGRKFQDHLGGRVGYIKPRNLKAFHNTFCTVVMRGDKFQPKIRTTDMVIRSGNQLNIQAMIAFESSISENLIFLKQFVKAALFSRKVGSLGGLFDNAMACSRHLIPLMWKYIIEHRILIPSGSRISLLVQSEVEPLDDSRITIDCNFSDNYGLPKVILDWRLSGRELEDIRNFSKSVGKVFSDSGLAELELDPYLEAGDPKYLDQLSDTSHQAGGCVMGATAEDGVVDKDLRVFGVDNLFVLGACVFPTSSNANTTFTAMAFGTRLADHLNKRNGTN